MKKIVLDPITRIEGHLRAEIDVNDEGKIVKAHVGGMLFRGLETILKGRHPHDVPFLAQRICGVCTGTHYRASMEAIENALGMRPPLLAQFVRDIVSLSLMIQDHIVHFYHLHSLDYFVARDALDANVLLAHKRSLDFSLTPYHLSSEHLTHLQERLKQQPQNSGIFYTTYKHHPSMKCNPEESLILLSHYFEALRLQKELSKMIALFAGKTPHPQFLVAGGITSIADLLNPSRLGEFLFLLKKANDFIERAYLPDAKMLANIYNDDIKLQQGATQGRFFGVGGYAFEGDNLFENGLMTSEGYITSFNPDNICETHKGTWYHPSSKDPFYALTQPSSSLSINDEQYSFIKQASYEHSFLECGPVARLMIGYKKRNSRITQAIETFCQETGIEPYQLNSTLGRNIARAIESSIVAKRTLELTQAMMASIGAGDHTTYNSQSSLSSNGKGRALLEVPRGVVSHYCMIENGMVENYQVIAPTTWNAAPLGGAYEQALYNTKISQGEGELECYRTLRSFDPCIACAVHIIQMKK